MNALDEQVEAAYYPLIMLTGSRTAQVTERTMRAGWVWSIADHADHARVEYAAGACPPFVFGTIGTKRNQPNPRRALDT